MLEERLSQLERHVVALTSAVENLTLAMGAVADTTAPTPVAATPPPAPAATPPAPAAKTAEEAIPVTQEELRAALQPLQRPQLLQVFEHLGITKLSDLPAERYAEALQLARGQAA